MAKPQLENGHTPIANELVEALTRVNFSAYESRILWAIFRKTYGWGKKTDRISYSQFESMTGIDHRHIGRTINSLKNKNVITCSGTGYSLEYGIQKDYEQWNFNTVSGTEFDTNPGTDLTPNEALNLTPKEAPITENIPENLTPIQGDLTPIQGESTPNEALNLTPKEAHTKAIKHIQKHITKESIILPDWIKQENWDAFLEMRKQKKSFPTEHAKKLLIDRLSKLRDEGNDPNTVLDESTMNGWKGVFALKNNGGNGNGAHKTNPGQLIDRTKYTRPEDWKG